MNIKNEIQNYIKQNKKNNIHNIDNDNRQIQIINFIHMLQYFNFKIKYIKSGTTGNIFQLFNERYCVALKMVPYIKKPNYSSHINHWSRPENMELYILNKLSQINLNDCIVEIYGECYTSIDYFAKLQFNKNINIKNELKNFFTNYEKEKYYPYVSLLFIEYCELGDLHSYLKSQKIITLELLRYMIFEIIYNIYTIQQYFPLFKHNDLKPNNLLLQKKKNNNRLKEYCINGQNYKIIDNYEFQIKIWDFDFSSINNNIKNEKLNSFYIQKKHINSIENKFYDIYFFLKSLSSWHLIKYPEFQSFLQDIIQNESILHNKNRLQDEIDYIHPSKILNHSFFKSYKL